MKISLLVLSLLSLSASALDVQRLQWTHLTVPKDQCQAEAERIGRGVASLTGVEIYQATSFFKATHSFEKPACVVEVSYLAKQPLKNLVSTNWYQFSSVPIELDFDPWNYSSLEECNAELETQVAFFETQTGLTALIKDCYATQPVIGHKGVVLRIQSFGTPKNRPVAFELPSLKEGQKEYALKVSRAIEKMGGIPFRIALTPAPSIEGPRPYVHYYAPAPLVFNLDRQSPIREFTNYKDCEISRLDAEDAISKANGSLDASVCLYRDSRATELHLAYTSPTKLELLETQLNYDSLDRCRADRDRAISFYQETLKKDVKSAFCVFNGIFEKFEMVLF